METSNVCKKCLLREDYMNKIVNLYIKITECDKFYHEKLNWFYHLDFDIYTTQEIGDIIIDLEFELLLFNELI